MSEYSYGDRERDRYRTTRTRVRDRDRDREPEFVEETTYIQRGSAPVRDLVFRGREDSIEEIPRAFSPPRGNRRRAKSVGRRDYYEDDYYDDYSYTDRTPRRGRLSRRESYYSDDDYDRLPRRRSRRKSKVEEVAEDLGLGGIVAAGTSLYQKARSKSRGPRRDKSRDRYGGRSRSSSSSRSRSGGSRSRKQRKWQHAARAAILAGAAEAVRSRKTPGAWTGEKGTRVATAAFSAAGIDGLVDRGREEHSKRHTAEAVIGGLVSNRLVHGSRSRSRGRAEGRAEVLRSPRSARSISSDGSIRPRSRSRSIVDRFRNMSRGRDRSRSPDSHRGRGLKELAAGGALAAAGKTIYDRIRSKSRRRRSPSSSSNDSYVPNRRPRYRSRDDSRDRSMDRSMDGGPGYSNAAPAAAGGAMMRGGGGGDTRSISSESTTDLEHQHKRLRGKELITAGLATAATIHAVHGVWNSISASEKRHKLVAEGEMSPEEARKRRSKALLQDAAAVGVAALGIKGAFSEWKEMKEHRDEVHELEQKRRKRRKMRERAGKGMGYGNMMPIPYGYGMGMMPPNALMAQGYGAGMPPGGPSSYADGNPYGGGANLPHPPMGEPSERY